MAAGELGFRRALGGLGLLALFLAFSGADVMSLKGCDEAFYAQIAREMVQGGDWITPHYATAPNFEKPPLLFWLVSSAFALLGTGDFQARLPVLACGIAAVLLTALLAWVVRRDARVALVAGGVTATTGIFFQIWHQVMSDVPAFLALVILGLGLLGSARDRRFGWLVGPALGMLVLAKGALAALIALACLPYLVWRRAPLTQPLLLGLVLGILPAIAWYGAMHAQHGLEFWRIHLGQQVVQRASAGLFAKDPLGPAFYLVHMLGTFLPWSLLVPGAVWAGWRRARAGDGVAVFALGFGGVFLVIISLMQTKFEHYALPLLLPVALLIADWVTEPSQRSDRWTGALYLGLSVLLAGAILALKLMRLPVEVPHLDLTLLAIGCLAGTFAWGAYALVRRTVRFEAALRLLTGTGLTFGVAAQLLHPWDAMPGLRQVSARVPAGSAAYLVMPVSLGEDFCTFAATRFRIPGALDVVGPAQAAVGPKGWYVGKSEHLPARPADRLVVDAAGWRLLERP